MTDAAFTPNHAQRIDQAHTRLDGLSQRVTELETSEKVAAVRMEHIKASLDAINVNINKVVWLIIAALLAAFIAFIVKGGLSLGQ